MPRIKPKGYLSKFSPINETRIKIAFCLYQAENPLTASEIAKDTNLSKQLVYYHLPTLVAEGVAISDSEGRYSLQSFFYDSEIMESICASICPIVTLIYKDFIVDEINIKDEQAMVNCIQTLLHFVSIEVQKLEDEEQS